MEYIQRRYPAFSACGLNCGLCPRHYTDGKSKCPGCAGDGFSAVHPSCGVLSCCQRKGSEYCFLCEEFPCGRYEGANQTDSFITHMNQLADLEKAKRSGVEAYAFELDEKIGLLELLLRDFDDGRKKSLFCLAVNLLDLETVRSVVERLASSDAAYQSQKTRAEYAARLLDEAARAKGISLTLRKKAK